MQLGMWDVCIICGPFMQAKVVIYYTLDPVPPLHCIHQPAKYQPGEWGFQGPDPMLTVSEE